ncbi:MAG: amidohydrolase family protein [Acidobacteria bacterium]|nr:amidohydrolase family protein [Acidobacteriota bacterium]
MLRFVCVITATFVLNPLAWCQQPIFIRNVRIFDGVHETLKKGNILIDGALIARIGEDAILAPKNAIVIDGDGRIVSPGFIDLHTHLAFQIPKNKPRVHPTVAGAVAADVARFYLERGFTTVRDAGGTHPDFAIAIDEGLIIGPRLFPSGSMISQTGGHGDFRARHEPHYLLDACAADAGAGDISVLADGVDRTLAAVRENLRLGATQIKIMGGGGVASEYDPLTSLQPSPAEIRAAVQAAEDWGTYVMAHAYTSEAVQRLVANGVRVIEHGHLIDEATAKLCAEKGIVISTQVSIFHQVAKLPGMTERNRAKLELVLKGMDNLMALIKKYEIKTGFGTDFVFGSYRMIGSEFTARAQYFSPAEIMKQATSQSAEVIRMAGSLNKHGRFGELKTGWLADLVLLEYDPFQDISVLERPDVIALVIKGGHVVVDNRAKK